MSPSYDVLFDRYPTPEVTDRNTEGTDHVKTVTLQFWFLLLEQINIHTLTHSLTYVPQLIVKTMMSF